MADRSREQRDGEKRLPPNVDDSDLVQRAVEAFIQARSKQDDLEPTTFAQSYPEALRKKISSRCRHFLQFDDFLGAIVEDDGAPAEPAGRRFGEYWIEDELGRGGMGVVYLAQQPSLRRRVALKVLASGLALSPRHVERFRREAAAAASLRHPAIVPVHAFLEVEDSFAFAMEFVPGRNLGAILDDLRQNLGNDPLVIDGSLGIGRDPTVAQGYVADCARLCADLASALACAHAAGLAHRDLKPRNVMVDDQKKVRLLDFGLAKRLEEEGLTASFDITGTVHYMSPEQTLQKKVAQDHRTDIFSLGVILYELLTLCRPFQGENLQQIVYEICFRDPMPIAQRNARVPRDLVIICEKALEKDPQSRYATAAEFEDDLRRFLRLEPIRAKAATPVQRVGKWLRRNRGTAVASCAALIAIVGISGAVVAARMAAERDAQRLTAAADEARKSGDFPRAIELATDALAAVPYDTAARDRLQLLRKEGELKATDAMRRKAEANVKLLESRQLAGSQRERAIVLALQAVALHDAPETRGAVLDALRPGHRVTTFDEGRTAALAQCNADGSLVVTNSLFGPARIFDPTSGALLRELAGRDVAPASAFHPDGIRIATGNKRGASLWDARTGAELRYFERPAPVHQVAFDSSGARLLAADNVDERGIERAVVVFDVATGKELGSSRGPRWSMANAITNDGAFAVSSHEAGAANVWDAATGAVIATLPIEGFVLAMALQPARADASGTMHNRLIALATDAGMVRVYTMPRGGNAGGELVAEARCNGGIRTVAFSPDGALLATGASDHTARLWRIDGLRAPASAVEASSGAEANVRATMTVPQLREAAMLPGHDGAVMCVQFSRSGDRIATACYDGSLRMFDANSGERLLRYETGGPMSSLSFAPNASRIYFESSGRRTQAIDFDAPLGVMELAYGETARTVAFGRDGVAFWTAGGDYQNQLCAFAADGSLLRAWSPLDNGSIGKTDAVHAIALHPTAPTLLVGTDSGAVATIDTTTGATLRTLTKVAGSVYALQWNRDGRRALAASRSAKVAVVVDTESGATIREITVQHDLRDAALSPDGLTVATCEADENTVRLWSTADGKLVRTLAGHEKTVQCVRFAAGGNRVLSCGDDGSVRLWSHDGALLRRFDAGEPLRRCAMSDDGSVVVATNATSRDAAAFVFDGATGTLRTRQSLHRAQIRGLALSQDGTRALTCGVDPVARAWPTDPVHAALQALPETAKQALPNHIR